LFFYRAIKYRSSPRLVGVNLGFHTGVAGNSAGCWGGGGICGVEGCCCFWSCWPWRNHLFCEDEAVVAWGTGRAMLAAREVPRRLARREDDWESVLAVVVVEVPVGRGPWEMPLG